MVTTTLNSGPLKGNVLTVRERVEDEPIPFESADPWEVGDYQFFVAVVRGQIIGYCVANRYQLKHVEVEKPFRREKIGSLLIATSKVSHAMVCETDLQAQLFLKACGFTCYDVIKHGPTAGRNGYLFGVPEYDS